MGDVTLENFLSTHRLIPDNIGAGKKILLTRFDDVPFDTYQRLEEKLFSAGIKASVYLGSKKFGKQIEYAVKDGYTHVLILGATELSENSVRIKDLTTREETTVSLDSLVDYLK